MFALRAKTNALPCGERGINPQLSVAVIQYSGESTFTARAMYTSIDRSHAVTTIAPLIRVSVTVNPRYACSTRWPRRLFLRGANFARDLVVERRRLTA